MIRWTSSLRQSRSHRSTADLAGVAGRALTGASRSGVRPIYRTEEIHFADIDPAVTEDRVGRHDMEIYIRDRHLQEIVLSAKHGTGRPPRHDDGSFGGA